MRGCASSDRRRSSSQGRRQSGPCMRSPRQPLCRDLRRHSGLVPCLPRVLPAAAATVQGLLGAPAVSSSRSGSGRLPAWTALRSRAAASCSAPRRRAHMDSSTSGPASSDKLSPASSSLPPGNTKCKQAGRPTHLVGPGLGGLHQRGHSGRHVAAGRAAAQGRVCKVFGERQEARGEPAAAPGAGGAYAGQCVFLVWAPAVSITPCLLFFLNQRPTRLFSVQCTCWG